ncbi:MAG: ABC transporter ATP-binding protein [Proteobacteria bacterium]|nr:ABC transporter ATP-binding protein [Pseudomonadota bacterium]
MSNKNAYINISNVSKHFGEVVAVNQVNMQIGAGEFFSLLGPSGCGKTTLLRMLAGLESPTHGEIFIDGKPMSDVPPHRRPTNMVFQNYAIFPHLNVRGNIAYGLRKDKLSKTEMAKRVDEALEMVKLPGFGRRSANELSGGQLQRIALARALVKRPKVLLLDEPLGALDKKLREEMQLELRALQESVGITFIFVTHDQEEALTLSDRVAVMARGDVLQIASPKNLYNQPESIEVADFIGQMNFTDALVRETDNNRVMIDARGLGTIQGWAFGDTDYLKPGKPVVVGIRPEKLSLTTTPPTGGINSVEGELITSAYLGDRSHFYVSVKDCEKPFAVATHEIELPAGQSLGRGKKVWLSWADESLVLLPPAPSGAE